MRRLFFILAGLSLAATSVSPAAATAPVQERSSFEVVDTIPAVVCGYRLRFEVRGTVTTRIFVDADGQMIRGLVAGPTKVTFTNLASGAIRTYAIPGPTFLDADGNLVRGTGPWFASDANGEPVIAAGNWVFEAGVPVGGGRVINVCAALA